MKYTIHGFSQRTAIKFGLDAESLLILRWFVDFKETQRMKLFALEDGNYFWVNYSTLLEELPILSCNKRNLAKKIDKLVSCNVLKKKIYKNNGTYVVFAFGENYLELISDSEQGVSKNEQGVSKNEQGGVRNQTGGVSEIRQPKILLQEILLQEILPQVKGIKTLLLLGKKHKTRNRKRNNNERILFHHLLMM